MQKYRRCLGLCLQSEQSKNKLSRMWLAARQSRLLKEKGLPSQVPFTSVRKQRTRFCMKYSSVQVRAPPSDGASQRFVPAILLSVSDIAVPIHFHRPPWRTPHVIFNTEIVILGPYAYTFILLLYCLIAVPWAELYTGQEHQQANFFVGAPEYI